jgi:hypothetical protein
VELAGQIALEMELPTEQVEGTQLAGLVHDIGKIAIPVDILLIITPPRLDGAGTAAGDYLIEATLWDTAGTVLDSRRLGISIRDPSQIPPSPDKPRPYAAFYPFTFLAAGALIVITAAALYIIRRRKRRDGSSASFYS